MRRDLTKTATVLQRFGVCVYIYVIYTESLAGGGVYVVIVRVAGLALTCKCEVQQILHT